MADHDHGYKLLFSQSALVANLLRELIHEDRGHESDSSIVEPFLLPLVLYRPWKTSREVGDLTEPVPVGLESYRLHLRYFLLDQGRLVGKALAPRRNLAALFRLLEKSRDAADIERVLSILIEWLSSPEEGSMRADLMEARTILADCVVEMTRRWKQEALQQEGREQGREEIVAQLRSTLLRATETRFGPLSERVREQVAALHSLDEVARLLTQVAVAPSLYALGLAEPDSATPR